MANIGDVTRRDFQEHVLGSETPVWSTSGRSGASPATWSPPSWRRSVVTKGEALKVAKLNIDDNPEATRRLRRDEHPLADPVQGRQEVARVVGAKPQRRDPEGDRPAPRAQPRQPRAVRPAPVAARGRGGDSDGATSSAVERGRRVRDIQHRLIALGLHIDPAELDGTFGPSTEDRRPGVPAGAAACRRTGSWARTRGASSSRRVIGSAIARSTSALRVPRGRRRALQRKLNALGFDAGKEDGIFGPRTDRAVREFQRNVASRVDGIVGLDTVHAISRYRPPVDARAVRSCAKARPRAGRASPSPVRSLPSNPTGSTRTRPTCHSRSPGSSPRRSSTWVLARCSCVRGRGPTRRRADPARERR